MKPTLVYILLMGLYTPALGQNSHAATNDTVWLIDYVLGFRMVTGNQLIAGIENEIEFISTLNGFDGIKWLTCRGGVGEINPQNMMYVTLRPQGGPFEIVIRNMKDGESWEIARYHFQVQPQAEPSILYSLFGEIQDSIHNRDIYEISRESLNSLQLQVVTDTSFYEHYALPIRDMGIDSIHIWGISDTNQPYIYLGSQPGNQSYPFSELSTSGLSHFHIQVRYFTDIAYHDWTRPDTAITLRQYLGLSHQFDNIMEDAFGGIVGGGSLPNPWDCDYFYPCLTFEIRLAD